MNAKSFYISVGAAVFFIAFVAFYIISRNHDISPFGASTPVGANPTLIPQKPRAPEPTAAAPLQSKILEKHDFSDTSAYGVYENVCMEGGKFLFLTNDKPAGQAVASDGKLLPEIQHYIKHEYDDKNAILPYRAFINSEYQPTSTWDRANTYTEGCSAVFIFDFTGGNIFHWSMKVAPAYSYLRDEKLAKKIGCEKFDRVILINRNSEGEINDWQKNFLAIATNNAPIEYSLPGQLRCFKKLFVPGSAVYIFPGPTDAIDFRRKTLEHLGLPVDYQQKKRVVLVKRQNRNIVNFDEVEKWVQDRVGKDRVDTVQFENLSFRQQVETMSKAALLIATHGAGLTNSIFLPLGASVIEVTPPSFGYGLYERIADQSGHNLFRMVTAFDPQLHAGAAAYASYTSKQCIQDMNCILTMKELSFKVDMAEFAVLFKQVEHTFLPLE
jgi:hypothetical protein